MSKIKNFDTNIGCEYYHDCMGCNYYKACADDTLVIESHAVTVDTITKLKEKFSITREQLKIIDKELRKSVSL